MYIEAVSRAAFQNPRRHLSTALCVAAGMLLGGCDLFGLGEESDRYLEKPATLQPERDTFLKKSTRIYTWDESLRRPGKSDSLIQNIQLGATRTSLGYIGDSIRPRVDFYRQLSVGTAPVAALTRLGLHVQRVIFDTLDLPDPGPGLPFPGVPSLGWRLDTTVGEMRFVRVLDRIETIKQGRTQYQCWAFAESTFWAGEANAAPIGTGTTWMGARGLARHQSEWTDFHIPSTTSGTLVREINSD
jgi:hypothetical protein